MLVITCLLLALVFYAFAGAGITGFITRGVDATRRWLLLLPLGFAFATIIYSEVIHFTRVPQYGFLASLIVPVLVNTLYMFAERKKSTPRDSWRMPWSEPAFKVFMIAFGVVLVVGASFILSGWNTYWGSGNADIIDGLRGRDYLLQTPAIFFDQGLGFYRSDPFAWYQYSSLAFLSTLFSTFDNANVFHLQGLLMLFFTVLGTYALAAYAFHLRHSAAALASVVATANAFYISTFYTGHEGSMVFGAMAPFILWLFLEAIALRSLRTVLLPAVLLTYCLVWTYPYPSPFLVIPLMLCWLYRAADRLFREERQPLLRILETAARIRRRPEILLALVIVAGVGIAVVGYEVWNYLEPVRAQIALRMRAWGISFYKEMVLLYWGVVPSPIAFSRIGGLLRLYPDIGLALGYVVSLSYIVSYAAGLRREVKSKSVIAPFLLAFTGCWVMFFVTMRYFVADSYFFYKFLYTTAAVPLIVVTGVWMTPRPGGTKEHVAAKSLRWTLLILFAASNAVILGLYNYDLLTRPYNGPGARAYAAVDSLRPYAIEGIFSSYAMNNISNDHGIIAAYQLETHTINTAGSSDPFRYQLGLKPILDIFGLSASDTGSSARALWENEAYRVTDAPVNDLLVPVDRKFKSVADSWYGPEHTPSVYSGEPFRWVSYKLDFFLLRPSNRYHYLEFCVEPGPGYDGEPFDLYVYTVAKTSDSIRVIHESPLDLSSYENNRLLGMVRVNGYQCSSVPLPANTAAMMMRFFARKPGRSLLPLDERYLDYRLSMIHLTNGGMYRPAARVINQEIDITPVGTRESLAGGVSLPGGAHNILCLWNGWYPLEGEKKALFRWVDNDAELFLLRPDTTSTFLTVDLERGPGLGTEPAQLALLVNGFAVDSLDLTGSHHWKVPLPRVLQKENVITLHVKREGKQVGADKRILNFRVFRISLSGQ